MLVMKFGGTSVGTGERIAGVAELVASRLPEGPFVVVSAMGGVTDALLALSRAAREGNRSAAAGALATLGERHHAALDALVLGPEVAATLRAEIGASWRGSTGSPPASRSSASCRPGRPTRSARRGSFSRRR